MRPAIHQIHRLCGRHPARGVEVGVETEFNARVILQEWELSGGGPLDLVLVEINPACAPEIRAQLRDHESRYRLMIGDSFEVATRFPDGLFDFVYLDDDHSYAGVTRSLTAWWPKVRWGGLLGGHDAELRNADCEVLRAVRDFFAPLERPWHVEDLDWWVMQ